MCLLKPKCHLAVQFGRKLCYLLQLLVRHCPGHIVDRFVALVAENLQLLYQLGIGIEGEFQRLNDFGVVADLRNGAIARSSERDCSGSQCRGEGGNKSKIGRNRAYF